MDLTERSHRAIAGVIRSLAFAGSVSCSLLVLCASARCEVKITGTAADLQLLAEGASTGEALEALARSFGVGLRLPPNVGRTLSGTYAGDLRQVIARILDGSDYILKVSEDRFEVV